MTGKNGPRFPPLFGRITALFLRCYFQLSPLLSGNSKTILKALKTGRLFWPDFQHNSGKKTLSKNSG